MKTVLYKVNCSTVEKRCRFFLSRSPYLQRTEPKNMLKVALSVLSASLFAYVHRHLWVYSLRCQCAWLPQHFNPRTLCTLSLCWYRCWILNLNGFFYRNCNFQFYRWREKERQLCKWDAIFFPFNGMKLPSNYTSSLDQIKFTRFPRPNEFPICLIWPSRLKKQTSLRNAMVNVCVCTSLRIQTNDQFRVFSRSQA